MRRPALPLLLAAALLNLGGCLTGADTDLPLRDAAGGNNSTNNSTNNTNNSTNSSNNSTGGTNNPMCGEGVELFVDADGDGFGVDGATRLGCPGEQGMSEVGGDCDDRVAAVNPGAAEVCDGVDNDCSGGIDDAPRDGVALFRDLDRDGAGDSAQETTGCEVSAGLARVGGDCDDLNPYVGPLREEVCGDRVDNDCDGSADELGCTVAPWTTCATPLQMPPLGGHLEGSLEGAPMVGVGCADRELPVAYIAVEVPSDMTGVLVSGSGAESDAFGLGLLGADCAPETVEICRTLVGEVRYLELSPGPHTLLVFGGERWELTLSYVNLQTQECTLPDVDGDGLTMCELDCGEGDPTRYQGARELCDGLDNSCSGEVDDLFAPCMTGLAGICAVGTLSCVGEDEVCEPAQLAGAEVCRDGQDNNCDGSVDERSCVALPPAETCANAVLLEDGVTVEGALDEARDDLELYCTGLDARELIYVFDVEQAGTIVTLSAETTSPQTIALLPGRCAEDVQGTECYRLDPLNRLHLDAGRYFLAVSGEGSFRMTLAQEDAEGRCSVPDRDGDGLTICGGDCDDTLRDISMDELEVCDGVDNNCNGLVDEVRDACTLQAFGVCAQGMLRCVDGASRCDAQLLGGDEVCGDALDNDCDGLVDEAECVELASGEQCSNARVLVDGERLSGTLAGSSADGSHACLGGDSFSDQYFRVDITEDQEQLVVIMNTSSEQVLVESYQGVCGEAGDCYALGQTLYFSLTPGSHYFSLVGSADYTLQMAHMGPPDWQCSVSDLDGDGWTICEGDCDEENSSIYPGARELCDGLDNNCNGRVDELSGSCTTDEPGVCRSGTQRCVEGQATCVPLVEAGQEVCSDGRDNDCDGTTDETSCEPLLPGDQCSNAINIGAGGRFGGDLGNFELARPATCLDEADDPRDAYYYLPVTGEQTQALYILRSGSASTSTVVSVYTRGCDGDSIVSCASMGSSMVLYLEPGDYFLRVEGTGAWDMSVALEQLDTGVCSVPDGDEDGATICQGDCADNEVEMGPGGIERCDGMDNDCNGEVDDVRGECASQGLGRCARGLRRCESSAVVCAAVVQPISEICGDDIDNDCDGELDEPAECVAPRAGDTCARAVPIDAVGSYPFNLTALNRDTFIGQCGDFPGSDQVYRLELSEPRLLDVYIPPGAGTIFAHLFRGDCELQELRDCWTPSTNMRQIYLDAGVWYLALSGTGSGALQISW